MHVDTFAETFDLGSHVLKYRLLDKIEEGPQKFLMLFLLDTSQYDHFTVHIKHWYRKSLQKARIWMMETVNILQATKVLFNMKKRN